MLKLDCKQCSTRIEVPNDITQAPDVLIVCPGCSARYRLRPRKTTAPQQTAPPSTAPPSTSPPSTSPQQTAPKQATSQQAAPPQASRQPAAPSRTPAAHHSLTPATPQPSVAAAPTGFNDQATVAATRPSGRGAPVFNAGDLAAGRYRVVRFLAQGGMGEVYEVEDLELRQTLALKTISAHAEDIDSAAVERFKREIALARSVTHPNVCRIFDLGQHRRQVAAGEVPPPPVSFLTMELLQGETLSGYLKRRGRLKTRDAFPLVEQMAAALSAAHRAQVVHRDFKSENVFLEPREPPPTPLPRRVVVTDFGVARGGDSDRFAAQVTGAGIVGTPAYMAPEQVEGGPITPATDIYALGIVIYEMITGRLPFESGNPLTTAVKRLKEPPPPPHIHVPDLEAWWEKAILRCLERDPAKRFASADEVVAALQPPERRPRPRHEAGPRGKAGPQAGTTPREETADAIPRSPRAATPVAAPTVSAVAPGATHSPGPPTATATTESPQRRSQMLGALLLLVCLVSAGLFVFNRDRELDRSRITPRRSVAVLGFKNLAAKESDAWLATALAEMLTTELARGEALRTIPGENVARARQQMEIEPTADLEGADLDRVRSMLGCDFLVHGSFVTLGESSRDIRLDVRLQDAALGTQLASLARDGHQEDLFTMVSELGSELRGQLGVDEAGGADDPLGGLPSEPEAARLYAVALDELRESRPQAAREKLEHAARLAPQSALVFSALSHAWEAEGYGERAAEAAARAFELSSPLLREDRLAVEGRYREATGEWAAAIDVYEKLSDYFPDDLEYGLRLVAAHTAQRDARSALQAIESLRRLPAPISEDPRIDLAEASAAGLESDFARQLEAANRATERATLIEAGLLVAQARLVESQAHRALGQLDDAAHAAGVAQQLYSNFDHRMGTAQALTALGNVHFDRGELDNAADRYRQVIDDYRRLGDQDATASGLNNLAMVLKRRGDLDAAQDLYEEAAAIFEATGDNLAMTFALNNLGVLLVARDHLTEASKMFERSRDVWQQLGNRSGLAYSLNNIAATRHLLGDLVASRSLHDQALAIRKETGEKSGEATSLTNLADVLRDLGELEQAEGLLDRAITLTEEIGDRSARAQAHYVLGRVQLDRGAIDEARMSHQQALELRQALDESHRVTDSEVALARVALEAGDNNRAEIQSQKAILACQRQGRPSEEARATAILALALLAQDRLDASQEAADGGSHLAQASEQPMIQMVAKLVDARVQAARGNVTSALFNLESLETDSREAGYVALALEAQLTWADIGLRAGRNGEARQRLQTVEAEAAILGLGLLAAKAEKL